MQKNNFDQVVLQIAKADPRYQPAAYRFIREGLDYTLKTLKRSSPSAQRHVTGPELLEGIKLHALKEFGPMSKLVLNDWGIENCQDFGQIVFNLVNNGVLGKSESDRLEDFSSVYTFDEAFVKPFLPNPQENIPVRARKKAAPGRTRIKKEKDSSIGTTPPSE
jgi:uncharacterized repeat protein (TIGR04138 family)